MVVAVTVVDAVIREVSAAAAVAVTVYNGGSISNDQALLNKAGSE